MRTPPAITALVLLSTVTLTTAQVPAPRPPAPTDVSTFDAGLRTRFAVRNGQLTPLRRED